MTELCFSFVNSSKSPLLYMSLYYDRDIDNYVGGRVVYGDKRDGISIVYRGTKVINRKFQDYVEEWLEVVDYRVTGVYYLSSTLKGNRLGSSVEYMALPGKKVLYSYNTGGCSG